MLRKSEREGQQRRGGACGQEEWYREWGQRKEKECVGDVRFKLMNCEHCVKVSVLKSLGLKLGT